MLPVLLKHAMIVCESSNRTKSVKEETVKLLCMICTVKTSRFYIPGETNIVERLRKQSFDKGIFATLTFIYTSLEKSGGFADIKEYIKEKVLNLLELNDLIYHANVIEQQMQILKGQPSQDIDQS